MATKADQVLLIKCNDEMGLIYKISNVLFLNKLNIVRNGEYVDDKTNTFFYRSEIEGKIDAQVLLANLTSVLPDGAEISIQPRRTKKIVAFATKEHHCLGDLLLRHKYNTFNAEIQAVISNHEVLRDLVEKFDIPFHYIPTNGLTREEHESAVMSELDNYEFDFMVLAKYMRILTENFVSSYFPKVINIHHSFLPAFIGANPYRQAFERGVKIIGATAHFVTSDLDEGPIIHQNVIQVDHTFSAKMMARAGRDVETSVFARALSLVFEDRVMINGNRTIIF